MKTQVGPLNKDYKRITVKCTQCGNMFDKKRNLVARDKNHFCSNECRWKWDKTSEEKKEATRRSALKNLSSYPRRTKPEQLVDDYLANNKLTYSAQTVINDRFCVDFLLPDERSSGVVVEVLGDYFHARPEKYLNGPINKIQEHAVADDKRRKAYLTACGYVVFGIWEGDILNNVSSAMKPIRRYLATGQLPLYSRFEHLQ
jgi:very-short-patch-repair endonuclease